MGVSLSEEISDRAKAGAEKASFTPSNRPFKAVVDDNLAFCGRMAKPDTVEAVNTAMVVEVLIVGLLKINWWMFR
jgi:hypothetical protein